MKWFKSTTPPGSLTHTTGEGHSNNTNIQWFDSSTTYLTQTLWERQHYKEPVDVCGEVKLNKVPPADLRSFSMELRLKTVFNDPPIHRHLCNLNCRICAQTPFNGTLGAFIDFMKSNEWSRRLRDHGGSEDDWRRRHFVTACEAIVRFGLRERRCGEYGVDSKTAESIREAIEEVAVNTFGPSKITEIWIFAWDIEVWCKEGDPKIWAELHARITDLAKRCALIESTWL